MTRISISKKSLYFGAGALLMFSIILFTNAGFVIQTNITSGIQYMKKIILVGADGTTTGVILDGNGSSFFNGNVGIGTTSPAQKLEIKDGDLQISKSAVPYSAKLNNNILSFNRTGSYSYIDQYGTGGGLSFRTTDNLGNLLTARTINSSGNVGIGTTSPQTPLHVIGNTPLRLERTGIEKYDFDISNNGVSDILSIIGVDAGQIIATFASNGRVGIGNTNPISALDVNGTITTRQSGNGSNITPFETEALRSYVGDSYSYPSINRVNSRTSTHKSWMNFNIRDESHNKITAMTIYGDGNVGIGTTVPDAPLHASGGASMSAGWNRTAILSASYPVLALNSTTSTNKRGGMGYDNSVGMRFWVNATTNDVVAGTLSMIILNNGNVGIGATPGYKLQVGEAADGSQARANAWNILSDRRLKKDLVKIADPLSLIDQINGYYYFRNTGTDTSRQVGVVSQEIEKVLPEIVSTDDKGYKSVDYSKITALLIETAKAQQKEIDELKQQVLELQNK